MTDTDYKAMCERVCKDRGWKYEGLSVDGRSVKILIQPIGRWQLPHDAIIALADAIEMRDAAKHRFRRNTADARLSALATELGFEVVPDRLPLVRLGPGGDFVHDIWGKDAP